MKESRGVIQRCFVFLVLWGCMWSHGVRAEGDREGPMLSHPLEKGDQSGAPIARGFFVQADAGLLSFLPGVGDGALMYRSGLMLGLRLGGQLHRDVVLYGLAGATLLDNTTCARENSIADQSCASFPYLRPRARRRPLARQGLSLLAGMGARWTFLRLGERLQLHTTGEAFFQVIPSDNLEGLSPGARQTLQQRYPLRTKAALGGGVGLGLSGEYFFLLKHFSIIADIRYTMFFTPFMKAASDAPLAGALGHALLVSMGLRYTI